MGTISIKYTLSEAGQKADLLAGGSGKASRTIILLSKDDVHGPRAIKLAKLDTEGNGLIDLTRPQYHSDGLMFGRLDKKEWDALPSSLDETIALLLDYAESVDATVMANRRKTLAELPVNVAAASCDWTERIKNYLPERMAEIEAYKAEQEEAEAEKKRKISDEIAAAEAKKLAEQRKLYEWAEKHGSETTKLRMQEGFGSWIVSARYDQFKDLLAWADTVMGPIRDKLGSPAIDEAEFDFDDFESEARISPDAEEIKALREARALLPIGSTAELVYGLYTKWDGGGSKHPIATTAELKFDLVHPETGLKEMRFHVLKKVPSCQ